MRYAIALAATAAALGLAAPAAAATYTFTLSGDYSASWDLDSNAIPDSFLPWRARYSNVTGTFDGLTGSSATIDFYTDVLDGGLTISDNATSIVLADPCGQVLFSGPTSAPTFLLGTYNLLNNSNNNAAVQLVIAEAAAAVPEPATWAMMIAGFGLVGGAMRRTSMRTRVSYAN